MAWGAIAGAAIGVVGGALSASSQNKATKKAAQSQQQASDAQIALQREQLARAQTMAQPYVNAGKSADVALDARWRGGNAAQPQTPYGAWNTSPASAYDRGAPTQAWTPQGAPQVSQPAATPASYAPPPPAPPQAGGWDWRSVNSNMLPPLPNAGTTTTQPAPNPNQNSPYGNWQNWRAGMPNYTAML